MSLPAQSTKKAQVPFSWASCVSMLMLTRVVKIEAFDGSVSDKAALIKAMKGRICPLPPPPLPCHAPYPRGALMRLVVKASMPLFLLRRSWQTPPSLVCACQRLFILRLLHTCVCVCVLCTEAAAESGVHYLDLTEDVSVTAKVKALATTVPFISILAIN